MLTKTLDQAELLHPVEVVFEAFIGQHENRSKLHLRFCDAEREGSSLEKTPGNDSLCVVGKATDGDTAWTFSCDFDPFLTIPLKNASVDFVFLRVPDAAIRNLSQLQSLIREAVRVASPSAEMLLLYSERETASQNAQQTVFTALSRRAKAVLRALAVRKHRALRSLLQNAGMRHFEWYATEFGAGGAPIGIHPINPESLWPGRARWPQWLRTRAWPALAVRTSKSVLPISRFQRAAIEAIRCVERDARKIETDAILVSAKEKIVVLLRGCASRIVIRLPFTELGVKSCRQNMRALDRLEHIPRLKEMIPTPLLQADDDSEYFSAETLVVGTPMKQLPQNTHSLQLVESLLQEINPAHQIETEVLEGGIYRRRVGSPLEKLLELTTRDSERPSIRRFFHDSLYGVRVPVGLTHGDLSISNLFIEQNRISGVIDWDDGSVRGIPVLDAINHLISRQYCRSIGFCSALAQLATRQWPVKEELDFLDRCYQYFGVEARQHFSFVLLHWVRTMSKQTDLQYCRDPQFVDLYIDKVIDFISGYIETNK